jgi:serine/threonine protein kinase
MQPEPDTQIVPPRGRNEEPAARSGSEAEPVFLQRWVGRYELIHRLAHGGMATVYLGRAKGKAGFEKIVAVKVIHPHLAAEAEFVGMFLDEARIASRIHHPHVVEILDLGESDGVYYMVMEFIEGENLAALVRALAGERLPIRVVLQILADTLEGLGAAHGLRDAEGRPYKLVHRDVSPHNILINLSGWAKVGDFGIMKAAGKASNTKTGELRGKLAYMSPEQARGHGQVDHRTDLFAVGVIAWELLTGERLFACPTEAATLEKVIACEIPPFAEARTELDDHPALREGLDTLLSRSLAADPEQRHANADEMLAEVKRLLRLADELPLSAGQAGEDAEAHREARDYLGALMKRFFKRRVEYARAALRRTGEHALIGSSREWPVDATAPVARPPTGSNPSLTGPVLVRGEAPSGSLELDRPPTGSQPGLQSSATHPGIAGGSRLAQWSMWLLLPMLGAAIAITVMLLLGPGFGRERPAAEAERNDPPAERSDPPTQPEQTTRSPSTSLAAREYEPIPPKPPGTIRWWFSTSPAGAQVFIAGKPEGQTPTFVHVPIGEEPVEIRLELDGYEPHVLQLPPANDQTFAPQLQPLESAPSPEVRPSKASQKRPRKGTKAPVKKPSEEPSAEPDAEPDKKAFVPAPEGLK